MNKFGIKPGITFGTAPQNVQNWWYGNYTNPQICKHMRAKYGVIPGQTFENLPQDFQNWWIANCGAER